MALEGYEWLREQLESAKGRERVQRTNELALIAKDLGSSVAQLAIAWCLLNPNVSSVILGATNRAQLAENLGALELVSKLVPAIVERIERVVANKPAAPTIY